MLRDRTLLALLAARLVSLTGSQMTWVALPWFVLLTTGSAGKMSIVLAAELVPVGVFGIPSGSLVTRLGARRTMVISDIVRAPLMALVPALHWAGALDFWMIPVLASLLGAFYAPYASSSTLILPEVLGEDEGRVAQGNTIFQGTTMLTAVLGPIAAGLLIGFIGAPSVLLVDAATYVVSSAVLATFVSAGGKTPQDESARGILAGLRFLLSTKLLRSIALAAVGVNVVAQALFAALSVLAYLRYGASARIAGVFFGSFGVGAVIGSVVAFKIVRRFDPVVLASVGIVAMGLPLWVLPPHVPWLAVAAAMVVVGLFQPIVNSPIVALLTVRTPAAVRAKVMTAVMTVVTVIGPLGLLATGPSIERWGLQPVLVTIAAAFTLSALAFAAAALTARRGAAAAAEPAPAVALD